jgi:hypothetical protein
MNVRRLFDYDDWANREDLARFASLVQPSKTGLRIMCHIIGVEWLWLAHLGWGGTRMAVWPDMPIAQCLTELDWLRDA